MSSNSLEGLLPLQNHQTPVTLNVQELTVSHERFNTPVTLNSRELFSLHQKLQGNVTEQEKSFTREGGRIVKKGTANKVHERLLLPKMVPMPDQMLGLNTQSPVFQLIEPLMAKATRHGSKAPESIVQCPRCSCWFFKSSMVEHMTQHTNGEGVKCSICEIQCDNILHYTNHLKEHSTIPTIDETFCVFCEKKFSTQIKLELRKEKGSGNSILFCPNCKASFTANGIMGIVCTICRERVLTHSELRMHVKQKHPETISALNVKNHSLGDLVCESIVLKFMVCCLPDTRVIMSSPNTDLKTSVKFVMRRCQLKLDLNCTVNRDIQKHQYLPAQSVIDHLLRNAACESIV